MEALASTLSQAAAPPNGTKKPAPQAKLGLMLPLAPIMGEMTWLEMVPVPPLAAKSAGSSARILS